MKNVKIYSSLSGAAARTGNLREKGRKGYYKMDKERMHKKDCIQ